MSGMFDGIENAQSFDSGVYPEPGVYELQINRCLGKPDRFGVKMFIAELKILASTNPLRPPGTSMSWIVKLNKDPALGNIKGFMEQAMKCWCVDTGKGLQAVQIDSATSEAIVGPSQPLAGVTIWAEFFNHKTQAGGNFTRVKWGLTEAQRAKTSQAA